MSKRKVILIAALAVFAVLLLCSLEVRSQPSSSGDYGAAFFYRSDIYSRDGLIETWTLDPGVRGDSLNAQGDYETWTGPEGACTDCPTGWTCACVSGDVDQEATIIYDYDYSLAMAPGGAFSPIVYQVMTFEANKCYQISWCHYGEAATEDFTVIATNGALTDVYDWATDTWGGGPTTTFANVPASWTCQRFYLRNGAVEKPDYLVGFSVTSGDGTNVFVDQFRVQELNLCDVTGIRGNVLINPATSDPLWGHSEVLLPRTGTGPAYKTGEQFDGVNDFQSCADATCEMDPILWDGGGYFSVGCRVMTDTVAGTNYIISKWGGAGQGSWGNYRSGNTLGFIVTDDGTNIDNNGVAVFVVGALHNFVSTFDPSGGPGACENNLYYSAYQVDIDATMTECAPFNSTANLFIGAQNAVNNWTGSMLECSLWERELTAIESNKYISPYFPSTNHGDGFYVSNCTQVASHATCSTQVCRDGTPNACQAEGTGTMALFGQYTEELDNNSFEAFTGDPSVANFDDWPAESGAVTAYLADAKHGDVSVRMKGGSLTGECIIGGGSDTYFEISAKQLNNGGGTVEVWLREYDTGFCSDQLAITMPLITCTPGSVWNDCGALFEAATWNVATSSYAIQLVDTVDGDMLIDNVSIKEASYHTPFVHCPTGSGSVTYNDREYELFNPLSSYIEAEGKDGYEDGVCISTWVYTDWAGDDTGVHRILSVPGTAGNNNRWMITFVNTWVALYIYDSIAATLTSIYVANVTSWTAGGWKYIEACSDNAGTIAMHYFNVNNSTWYDGGVGGGGTGIQNGQTIDFHIGHVGGTNYCDCYQSEIHLSPYPSGAFVWPQKGFNGGRPPVNHAPY